jgi:cell division protein FtsB
MQAAARIRWDRVGRWALIATFAFVMFLYVGPAISWVTTWREASHQREQVAELRAANQQLRARRDQLRAPGAIETEARGLGMVKAGERAYVVQDLPK